MKQVDEESDNTSSVTSFMAISVIVIELVSNSISLIYDM